jgi:hypothetical protein
MKRTKFSDEQIIGILREQKPGQSPAICAAKSLQIQRIQDVAPKLGGVCEKLFLVLQCVADRFACT